ncbi:hypothetical protein BGZ65_007898 [Modicella reniformis]|uniref:MIF4G domain-containing protein n=1 Tax=Modicella reniformis TaxID=1440133 RepID=A0A9P6IK43_9FUNG|nr:hypothetical protein BGZ65_007898 [Modicella reniformis]
MPQPRPINRFNVNAAPYTPPTPRDSKRIPIINPESGAEVKLDAAVVSSSTDAKGPKPVVVEMKNPESGEKPTITLPSLTRTPLKIVNPNDVKEEKERKEKEERVRKEKEEKERLEREEKERIERETKEAEERRIREEQEEKERLVVEARVERERQEREELERIEREECERKEKVERERLERVERERLEREECERQEREERERKEKEREECERLERVERERKEQEEREIKEMEERERVEREERERKEQEEKERLEKERLLEIERVEAERKRKEEEERVAREKAEAEKVRIEMEKVEQQAREKQEAREKLEAERRVAIERRAAAIEAEKSAVAAIEAEKSAVAAAESKPADTSRLGNFMPGLSVDISRTASVPASMPSARIENFNAVSYPSHIQSPVNADGQGKYRYGRDFLMQFMSVCTDKPDSLPSLDVLGGDGDRGMPSPGGSLRPRTSISNGRGKPTTPMVSTMGSFNLGRGLNGGMSMGGMSRNPSNDNRMQHRTSSDNNYLPRSNNLARPPSQRGNRGGNKRGGGQGRNDRGHQDSMMNLPLPDVAPLERTENAWNFSVNASTQSTVVISGDEPLSEEQVSRKVKGLLNKLTLEKFDGISDKLVEIANLSTKEDDGATLQQCIRIIFEKATDEPNFGSVYAKLCHKLMDKVSNEVKDKTAEGSTGGKLFRKYLLHRCQEDFTKGWKDKADGVSLNDKDGPDLMSDEYYILMKAKRQGLGLIHFIGELFKLSMLTEKIMHECVKKLLANVKDPEEEEIEGLCKLMTTIGLQLDHDKAKPHMDVYFTRMAELTKNTKLPSRIRFMVFDVIDLRNSKWVNKRAAAGPKTIAAIHEEAARQQEEKEMMRRTASSGGGRLPNRRDQMSRNSSFRGSNDARHDILGGVPQVATDGWSTVGSSGPTMTKKAGDLSSFGNTSRSKVSGATSLTPATSGSVFGVLSKKRADKATPTNEAPRQISSANSFA